MGLSFDLLGYKSFWLWDLSELLALDESFGFGTSPTELLWTCLLWDVSELYLGLGPPLN